MGPFPAIEEIVFRLAWVGLASPRPKVGRLVEVLLRGAFVGYGLIVKVDRSEIRDILNR